MWLLYSVEGFHLPKEEEEAGVKDGDSLLDKNDKTHYCCFTFILSDFVILFFAFVRELIKKMNGTIETPYFKTEI